MNMAKRTNRITFKNYTINQIKSNLSSISSTATLVERRGLYVRVTIVVVAQ